ncbi:MAG: GAF domain-containing protein [Candidatus Mariimomonas ferrooxydans]
MRQHIGEDFFQNIRRTVKISYFVGSIIPLGILVYLTIKYIYPYLTMGTGEGLPIHLIVLLLLSLVVSILGLVLSTRATNASVSSLQDLYSKLNTLVDITKQFRETLYIDILLENIVKSAIHLNSAETGSILLFDESGDLRFKVLIGQRGQKIKDRVVKRGEGISGWVAETGKSAIVNDVAKNKLFNPAFDKESGFKTRSIMCVPLVHNKEVIGVIEVLNRRIGVFTDDDEKLLYSLADQAAISISQSRVFESRHSDIIHITEILIRAQDYIREKRGHARRVANYANVIGKHMGLSEPDLKNLYYAALFHDIGFLKIEVEDPWNCEKWEKEKYIQSHPQLGYDMIRPISLWRDAADIILSHHERHDGNGYPSKKKGEDIPVTAKVLSVADTFDVLTSKYSYKSRVDYSTAISEITAYSGKQFDPDVVKAFEESIRDEDLVS